MERENRYTVIKNKDAAKYLTDSERKILQVLCTQIGLGRRQDGKDAIEGVVVEHDWPEYEPTWNAIEKRVDAEI